MAVEAVPSPRPRANLFWRIGRFLAIVWGIAGAFWLLFQAQIEANSYFLNNGLMPDYIAEHNVVPTDCSSVVDGVPEGRLDEMSLRRARMTSLALGVAFGIQTAYRDQFSTEMTGGRTQLETLANMLATPVPELPKVKSPVRAMGEFEDHVMSDAQCTGALLDRFYGAKIGDIYKFGAFAGYTAGLADEVAKTRDKAIFARDMRKYGRAAGLSDEIGEPLIEPGGDSFKSINAVQSYLLTAPM